MGFKEVGVEAIVKGLAAFQGDMRKINSSLQSVRSEGTLLQRAFGSITDAILGFGEHIVRIAEVALGVLLRDAIRAVIDAIKELISTTIEAGNEFQTLEIRLGRLNFNNLIESGMDYNTAISKSIELTQEQLKWLQLLAAQSPYDATDVANIYTLARSYSFLDDQARGLTTDVLNFVSGMGLTSVEAVRIIKNFGQMTQMSKIMQRDLNDLATGAFVPVNDVLKIMSEQTGVAMDKMDDFRKTGESVPAFLKAFSTLVEQRFAGATEQMSNTFVAATDNIKDLVKGIFGLNAVKPILDVLGKKAAAFANAFTDNPERWDRAVGAVKNIGKELASLVSDILDRFMPSSEAMADGIIGALEKVATWLRDNRAAIMGFFEGIATTFKTVIIPFITDKVVPAFQKISDWFYQNRNVITLFFQAIREIFSEFIGDLMGGQGPAKSFGDAITKIMWFVIENKDAILKWLEVLWSVFAVWQVISTVLHIAGGIILSVVGFVLGLVGAITGLFAAVNIVIPILTAVGGVIATLGLPVIALVAGIGLLAWAFTSHGKEISTTVQQLWYIIKYYFNQMLIAAFNFGYQIGTFLQNKWNEIKQTAMSIDWPGIGKSIVQGIANGISAFGGIIASAAKNAAKAAYQAALNYLGIHSPSKLFFDIGANTMEGMALGIQKAAGMAAISMQAAMARVSSQAIPSVTNSTVYNSTVNNNLTVNSSAPTEPIIQDFNMMSSLAGV